MRSLRERAANRLSVLISSLLLLATLFVAVSPSAFADEKHGEKISVYSKPLLWHPEQRTDLTAGKLEWAGGVELKSDAADFGGFSGLAISADGSRLLSISDEGMWLTAQILYDEKGRLSGVAEASLAPVRGLNGKSMGHDKTMVDAEALTVDGTDPLRGTAYIAFERLHRIWSYDLGKDGFSGKPTQILTQREFGKLNSNSGIEAMTLLPRNSAEPVKLLAITENTRDPRNDYRAFYTEGRNIIRFSVRPKDPFRPTDIARLPNGDFLLLERRFSALAGVGMQIRLLKAADIKSGAVVDGEILMRADPRYSIDNMEGISVRDDGQGGALIYVISDDNMSPLQRTLLLMFRLHGPEKNKGGQ
jgi:hypothetical protein